MNELYELRYDTDTSCVRVVPPGKEIGLNILKVAESSLPIMELRLVY